MKTSKVKIGGHRTHCVSGVGCSRRPIERSWLQSRGYASRHHTAGNSQWDYSGSSGSHALFIDAVVHVLAPVLVGTMLGYYFQEGSLCRCLTIRRSRRRLRFLVSAFAVGQDVAARLSFLSLGVLCTMSEIRKSRF